MGEPFESYSPDMVWEFNDSYTVSINLIKPVRNSARDQPPLSYTLGRGVRVDLSEETIHRFLFRQKFERPGTIDEFEYSMKIVRYRRTMRDSARQSRGKSYQNGWLNRLPSLVVTPLGSRER